MAKIVSKLDLNKTPQLVDNNSLIFAKNVKVLKDGTIGPDSAVVKLLEIKGIILGQIVGLNNTVYLFIHQNSNNNSPLLLSTLYPTGTVISQVLTYNITIYNNYKTKVYTWNIESETFISFLTDTLLDFFGGTVSQTGIPVGPKLYSSYPVTSYLNINWTYLDDDVEVLGEKQITYNVNEENTSINIYKYFEKDNCIEEIESAWSYSGGNITGVCTINNTGEEILTICEYFDNNEKQIPIKHINTTTCSKDDDESIYTQAPSIPITNLTLVTTYTKTIPNGVYQFFVRYKIYKDFYTDWFPCSKECFAGSSNVTDTVQGSVKYINIHKDSGSSFVFNVSHLFDGIHDVKDYTKNFEEFQLGFILSHDDSINARSWKSFKFDTTEIYFDYDQSSIEEINIDDLLRASYELFNVKNISYFKNKLYISNFIETDFNPNLEDYAKQINVELKQAELKRDDTTYIDGYILEDPDEDNLYSKVGNYTPKELIEFDDYIAKSSTENTTTSSGSICKLHVECDCGSQPYLFLVKGCYDYAFHNSDVAYVIPNFRLVAADDKDWDHNHYFYDAINGSQINTFLIVEDTSGGNRYKISGNHQWDIKGHPLQYHWYAGGTDPASSNINNGSKYFYMHSHGFVDWQNMADYFPKYLLETYINIFYPVGVITKITVYSDDDNIDIYDASVSHSRTATTKYINEEEDTVSVTSANYNDFRGLWVNMGTEFNINPSVIFKNHILPYITKIDALGNFYITYNNNTYKLTGYSINYNTFTYSVDTTKRNRSETKTKNPNPAHPDRACYVAYDEIKCDTVSHVYNEQIKIKSSLISTDYEDKQYCSLLPFTEYNFYIHYVKDNGVSTNGYLIPSATSNAHILDTYDETLDINVIYPKFSGITIPQGYSSYFISICKIGNDIASGFNFRQINGVNYVDCLEADTLLYSINDNIEIFNSNGKLLGKGTYYPSSTTNPIKLFGNVGCIGWTNSEVTPTSRYWIKITSKSSNVSKLNQLIKLTPYLNATVSTYDNYSDLNMPGYFVRVCKPKDVTVSINNTSYSLYINGSDAYGININNTTLNLKEYGENLAYIDTYNFPTPTYIYSNFNLHYLNLFEDLTPRFRTYTILGDDGQTVIAKDKQIIYLFDSSTISYIYELSSMYKDYTRKLYSPKSNDKINIFDTVIRASDVNIDEVYRNIYKFYAEDYYNVPANRGNIINLFSIQKSLYIHCEHSLFKFSGNNSLTAKDTEVQLTDADIFDTGIEEIFDAEHGYGGLQKKEHSLITYNAYVFYDAVVNTIYGYFGNNNLVNLSESIHKLLNSDVVSTVLFASDEMNDRFFANINYINNDNVCLSFNFATKSFVSIHDFNFNKSFSTRSNCYFVDTLRLFGIDNLKLPTSYSGLNKKSKLFITDMSNGNQSIVENCLDIVCNIEYEKIKVLNYINWICNQINKYTDDIDGVNLFVAEENISKYAGSKLRIYTDQCSTELINLENSNGEIYEQNTQPISSPNSYIYPRYNCGVWSLNYFRDVKNIEDIFKYKDAIPPTQQEEAYNRGLVNSDRSLIYGKYFVLRLIFRNKNFKLENINFNIQDYEKV